MNDKINSKEKQRKNNTALLNIANGSLSMAKGVLEGMVESLTILGKFFKIVLIFLKGKSTKEAVVDTVDYKYGKEAS